MTCGAGILFVSTWPQPIHCLAGYQPKRGGITGLGGKVAADDTSPFYTACREVLEELLGIESPVLTAAIVRQYSPIKEFGQEYITFIMTFRQLEGMLCDVAAVGASSPFYDRIPICIADCVLMRQPAAGAEVQELALLPLRGCLVLEELLGDMRAVV
jgi:hypothetical protein